METLKFSSHSFCFLAAHEVRFPLSWDSDIGLNEVVSRGGRGSQLHTVVGMLIGDVHLGKPRILDFDAENNFSTRYYKTVY